MPAIQITALHDPVAIVHIPVALASTYTTKLYWTIDQAARESDEFFNVTSNRIEIAIFASAELILAEWMNIVDLDVKISQSWRVFEISSGDEDDGGNYDSPHLRHVSAPLAKAGITILYQSSYFTDFLLVKETDFEKASQIFAEQGWHVDPTLTPAPRRRSRLLNSRTPASPSPDRGAAVTQATGSAPPPPSLPEITVLPSPLACVGFSRSAETRIGEKIRRFLVWPDRVRGTIMAEQQAAILGDQEDQCPPTPNSYEEVHENDRPFLSYTRTEDGSSLVTEVDILRGMFANDEELHSGGELLLGEYDDGEVDGLGVDIDDDEEDCESSGSGYSHRNGGGFQENGTTQTPPSGFINGGNGKSYSLPPTPGVDDPEENIRISWYGGDPNELHSTRPRTISRDVFDKDVPPPIVPQGGGRKRCLQLDLRSVDGDMSIGVYHLDKSGLVTRFSTLLQTGNIRMLYSSTFHTANILVESRDVRRAKRLLETKRSREWSMA